MDNQVIVSDYSQMDRVLREERQYILDLVKKVKKAGCNVLLIQKSILRWVLSLQSYGSCAALRARVYTKFNVIGTLSATLHSISWPR
jgi:T-complex protein 1 subunit delta